jgi:predicted nucleic acid-binding protein
LPTSADLLLDTSAAVPFLVMGHDAHKSVFEALSEHRLGLAGHAAFETFSVLTRLPGSSRVPPLTASKILQRAFPNTKYLGATRSAKILAQFADSGITGGAVYDALVAACALEHRCILVTRDRRALSTYAAVGAEVLHLS